MLILRVNLHEVNVCAVLTCYYVESGEDLHWTESRPRNSRDSKPRLQEDSLQVTDDYKHQ